MDAILTTAVLLMTALMFLCCFSVEIDFHLSLFLPCNCASEANVFSFILQSLNAAPPFVTLFPVCLDVWGYFGGLI